MFLLFLTSLASVRVQAAPDTLFAHLQSGRWVLFHILQQNEKLEDAGRLYNVLPRTIAAENGVAFGAAIVPGLKLRIPLSPRNLTDSFSPGAQPVVFRCAGVENFTVLAGSIDRSISYLQRLNPGLKPYCSGAGARVLLGYLKQPASRKDEIIPATDVPQPDTAGTVLMDNPMENTPPKPPVPAAEAEFEDLVSRGAPLNQTTGPITFFPGGTGDTYYAFHNTAPHGAIVRFRNPANGRVVYAKVIGKVPVTKQYYKTVAAVSENARKALGSLGDARMWCEIAYSGY